MPPFDPSYEFTGYIVPGAVLLLGLMLLWPPIREYFGTTQFEHIGVFIIVAFVLGHLLHAIGHLADQKISSTCEGEIMRMSSVVPHSDDSILTDKEFTDLTLAVQKHFDGAELNTLNKQKFCNLITRIKIAVRSSKHSDLLDVFARDYGLYLALVGGFLVLGLVAILIVLNWCTRPRWIVDGEEHIRRTYATSMFIILGLATFLAAWRILYFGRLYARELLLSFLSLSHSGRMI